MKMKLMVAALVAVGTGSFVFADEQDTKNVTIEATVDKDAAEEIAQEVAAALEGSSEVRSVKTAVEDDAEFCENCQTNCGCNSKSCDCDSKNCGCNKPPRPTN